jgi:hypothetical protein
MMNLFPIIRGWKPLTSLGSNMKHYRKFSKEEYRELFKELNEAHNKLCLVEDFLLDESSEDKKTHNVAESAVLLSYVLRSKVLMMFNDEYPFLDRNEHYDITGRDQRY